MTEPELNKAVADELVRLKIIQSYEMTYHNNLYYDGDRFNVIDYCNNWNDLMPLVEKYDIGHWSRGEDGYQKAGRWMVQHVTRILDKSVKNNGRMNYRYIESVGDNLKRAYCECLLKVLESKIG